MSFGTPRTGQGTVPVAQLWILRTVAGPERGCHQEPNPHRDLAAFARVGLLGDAGVAGPAKIAANAERSGRTHSRLSASDAKTPLRGRTFGVTGGLEGDLVPMTRSPSMARRFALSWLPLV